MSISSSAPPPPWQTLSYWLTGDISVQRKGAQQGTQQGVQQGAQQGVQQNEAVDTGLDNVKIRLIDPEKLKKAWEEAMASQGLGLGGAQSGGKIGGQEDSLFNIEGLGLESLWMQEAISLLKNEEILTKNKEDFAKSKEVTAQADKQALNQKMDTFMMPDSESANFENPEANSYRDFINNQLNPVTNQLTKPIAGATGARA